MKTIDENFVNTQKHLASDVNLQSNCIPFPIINTLAKKFILFSSWNFQSPHAKLLINQFWEKKMWEVSISEHVWWKLAASAKSAAK